MDAAQANADIMGPPNPEEKLDSVQRQEADQSLDHANICADADCNQPVCTMIKDFKIHFASCKQKLSCVKCKFLFKHYGYHARTCADTTCQQPYCAHLKQKMMLKKSLVRRKRRYAVELLHKTISTDHRNCFGGAHDQASLAKQLEVYVYQMAFTQAQYYRLLAVKKWDIEMYINGRGEEGTHNRESVAVQDNLYKA